MAATTNFAQYPGVKLFKMARRRASGLLALAMLAVAVAELALRPALEHARHDHWLALAQAEQELSPSLASLPMKGELVAMTPQEKAAKIMAALQCATLTLISRSAGAFSAAHPAARHLSKFPGLDSAGKFRRPFF